MSEETVTLNSGRSMPSLGLGTWLPDPMPGMTPEGIKLAINVGYRHLDCAFIYQNEHEVGEALETILKEGKVKREDLFIASKLWNCFHDPEEVESACRECLQRLNIEYLDLFIVHTPFSLKKGEMFPTPDNTLGYDAERMSKTWQAMEALQSSGLVKDIGVSNFTITKLEALLKSAKTVPAVNQIECHPYLVQHKLQKYCKSKGIQIVAYAPIGSPGRWEKPENEPVVMEDPLVKELAAKYQATPAQICIAFQLCSGNSVIPKSFDEDRLKENLKSLSIELSVDDVERLKGLCKNLRYNPYDWVLPQGVTVESAWDVVADEAFVLKGE